MPRAARWQDMDFDPRPVLSAITCPVLLYYGERDEWTPIARSIRVWRAAVSSSHNPAVRVVRLPGTGHGPFMERGPRKGSISPRYTNTLRRWVRNGVRRDMSS